MLIHINSANVIGESGTGFEKRGNKGPFECGNCSYFKNGDACTQKDMKAKSKEPRHSNGSVVVDSDDCCEYVDRIGKRSSSLEKKSGWRSAAEERAKKWL